MRSKNSNRFAQKAKTGITVSMVPGRAIRGKLLAISLILEIVLEREGEFFRAAPICRVYRSIGAVIASFSCQFCGSTNVPASDGRHGWSFGDSAEILPRFDCECFTQETPEESSQGVSDVER